MVPNRCCRHEYSTGSAGRQALWNTCVRCFAGDEPLRHGVGQRRGGKSPGGVVDGGEGKRRHATANLEIGWRD